MRNGFATDVFVGARKCVMLLEKAIILLLDRGNGAGLMRNCSMVVMYFLEFVVGFEKRRFRFLHFVKIIEKKLTGEFEESKTYESKNCIRKNIKEQQFVEVVFRNHFSLIRFNQEMKILPFKRESRSVCLKTYCIVNFL